MYILFLSYFSSQFKSHLNNNLSLDLTCLSLFQYFSTVFTLLKKLFVFLINLIFTFLVLYPFDLLINYSSYSNRHHFLHFWRVEDSNHNFFSSLLLSLSPYLVLHLNLINLYFLISKVIKSIFRDQFVSELFKFYFNSYLVTLLKILYPFILISYQQSLSMKWWKNRSHNHLLFHLKQLFIGRAREEVHMVVLFF